MPGEEESTYTYKCYICIMKDWIEILKTETDMFEDSFDTGELDIEEVEKRITAKEIALVK